MRELESFPRLLQILVFTVHFHYFQIENLIFVNLFGKLKVSREPIMEVTFANQRLHKLCNSASKLRGEYGPRMAALIQQRLADLAAVDNLELMRNVPADATN